MDDIPSHYYDKIKEQLIRAATWDGFFRFGKAMAGALKGNEERIAKVRKLRSIDQID
jgi:hypothetical protein